MTRPVRARINLSALQHNFELAKQSAADSQVMAVIKADAYGHGMVRVAQALQHADAFAVAAIEEALVLRQAGIRKPIVLLEGIFSETELELADRYQLQLVVHDEIQIAWLENATLKNQLTVWLKVDTGMHRLGVAPEQAQQLYKRLAAIGCIAGKPGWFSHFACADEPDRPETSEQIASFDTLLQQQPGKGSLANSAALLTRADACYNWVRPGIMLYGSSPLAQGLMCPVALRPVMTLATELIAIHQRKAGEAVGYGGSYICPDAMCIGVAAIGYGDGYPRHAPAGTPVLVNGRRCEIAGRVSMDMITIDLTAQADAKPGDQVVLWGDGLSVDEIASQAGTIGYELFCGVTARVKRDFVE